MQKRENRFLSVYIINGVIVCLAINIQEGWLSPTERASVSAHFGLRWVRPWDNRVKCYMDGKRIQCLSNASQHVLIYLQPFTSYSEILVGNCNVFLWSYPLNNNNNNTQLLSCHVSTDTVKTVGVESQAFNAPFGVCSHWNSGTKFGPQKTRIMGLPGSEDSLTIG